VCSSDLKDSNFGNLKKLLDAIRGNVPSGGAGTPGSNAPVVPPKKPSAMMPDKLPSDYNEWW
jgi:hypothetical protein